MHVGPLGQKITRFFKRHPKRLIFIMRFWPPLWFTGIRVAHCEADLSHIRVEMPLRFYNRNILGIQFGGSLFSMTDPWYMMMIWMRLGDDYNVIDSAASINFLKPGLSRVYIDFILTDEDIADIKTHTDSGEKYLKTFNINILDDFGNVVSEVTRTIYIRKKPNT